MSIKENKTWSFLPGIERLISTFSKIFHNINDL